MGKSCMNCRHFDEFIDGTVNGKDGTCRSEQMVIWDSYASLTRLATTVQTFSLCRNWQEKPEHRTPPRPRPTPKERKKDDAPPPSIDLLVEVCRKAYLDRVRDCEVFDKKTGDRCGAPYKCDHGDLCVSLAHLLLNGWPAPSIPTPDCTHCGGTGKQGGGE